MTSYRRIIGITGGIGGGKSTVGAFLEKKGFAVVDCDRLSRDVSSDPDVLAEIKREFGDRFVLNGRLDRRALSQEIFSDAEKTEKLNDIFHGRIFERLEHTLKDSKGIVFVEIQLLPFDRIDWFDSIWFVEVTESERLRRASQRDGRAQAELKAIIERQRAYQRVARKRGKLLNNDGSIEELARGIEKLIAEEVAEFKRANAGQLDIETENRQTKNTVPL